MVEKVKIEIEGTKEINEVGVAVKVLIQNTMAALKDGWQPGQDIPSVMLGSYQSLAKAIDGLSEAGKEVEAAPIDAIMGAMAPIAEGIEIVLEAKKAKEIKGAVVGNKEAAKK